MGASEDVPFLGLRFLSLQIVVKMQQLARAARVVATSLFAVAVLGLLVAAYVTGYRFMHTEQHYVSFGLYGALLGVHLFTQSLFACLEHRRRRETCGASGGAPQLRRRRRCTSSSTSSSVALCIAAFQEDPEYLRQCLCSVQRLAFPGHRLKVILVVDGNRPEDTYMLDIFQEVLGSAEGQAEARRPRRTTGCYVWASNFHAPPPGEGEGGQRHVQRLVRGTTDAACILQKWGGKREVMYTAFRALGDSVDYVQVGADAAGTGRREGIPTAACAPPPPVM